MKAIFDFSLLDVWNNPIVQILRATTKVGVKAVESANAKADNQNIATSEQSELSSSAWAGDSNAQCAMALYYAEKQDYEQATYWLMKSVEQGNEYAIEILDMLQSG